MKMYFLAVSLVWPLGLGFLAASRIISWDAFAIGITITLASLYLGE